MTITENEKGQGYKIRIPYTGLGLKNYVNTKVFKNLSEEESKMSKELLFNHLILWDSNNQKMYFVNGRSISKIQIYENESKQKTTMIYISWSKEYKPIRTYKLK